MQCTVMFVYISLRSYWIVIWHMWNADLTPRKGRNSKLKSSHAGSLSLAPFSPPSVALSRFPLAYNNKWVCSQAKISNTIALFLCTFFICCTMHLKISEGDLRSSNFFLLDTGMNFHLQLFGSSSYYPSGSLLIILRMLQNFARIL